MRHIPNFFTLANLCCGCCAIVCILGGSIEVGSWFVAGALVLDWLDGTAARLLKICSPLGRELDSMADMVSFGVVPGMIIYTILAKDESFFIDFRALPAFILSAFSGLRLAKFNLDTRQTDTFIGLPTPSCTMFVLGWGLAWEQNSMGWFQIFDNIWLNYLIIGLFSFLLVAEIPMYSIKLKKGSLPMLLAILVVAGLIFWKIAGLGFCLIIGGYILISLLFFKKN